MKTLLFVYLGSIFLALIITPMVIRLALRIKAIDIPGARAIHTRPVPRIGGVAVFASAMCLFIAVLFVDNTIGAAFRNMHVRLITLFGSAGFIFLIGLLDDLKGLPVRFKFMTELFAAGALCFIGVRISSIAVTEQWILNLGIWSWPFTILWIVGITNAVNLSDGLDGLAAGISGVACGVIAIFSMYQGSIVMTILMLALLGSLTGFLFFNFNPAKIFMGDCGSLFLGFTIASSSIVCSTKSSTIIGLALPVLALGVPIFDTLFSMLRRFLERRSMFSPDRGHFHHRLVDLGLKQRHVVILIYIITFLAAGMGMFMMVTRNGKSLVVFCCILLLLLLVFRVVGSVKFREVITGLQKKHEIASQRKEEQKSFEQAQLSFRNAHTFDQWWSAACEAAERMHFEWISLKTKDRNGSIHIEVWRMNNLNSEMPRVVVMTIPLDEDGADKLHEFEIAISVIGSYESAGNRATLFNRLIDEHNLISV